MSIWSSKKHNKVDVPTDEETNHKGKLFTHSFSFPFFFLVMENWAQILAKNARHVPTLSYIMALLLLFCFYLRQGPPGSPGHEVLLSQCLCLPLSPTPLRGVRFLWDTSPPSIIYYNCMKNLFFSNFWDYNITTSFPPSPSSPKPSCTYSPPYVLSNSWPLFSIVTCVYICLYILKYKQLSLSNVTLDSEWGRQSIALHNNCDTHDSHQKAEWHWNPKGTVVPWWQLIAL